MLVDESILFSEVLLVNYLMRTDTKNTTKRDYKVGNFIPLPKGEKTSLVL